MFKLQVKTAPEVWTKYTDFPFFPLQFGHVMRFGCIFTQAQKRLFSTVVIAGLLSLLFILSFIFISEQPAVECPKIRGLLI